MAKFKTGEVRLSYAHLFEKFAQKEGDEPKFSAQLMIPKTDTACLNAVKKAYQQAVAEGTEKFGSGFAKKTAPLIRKPGEQRGILYDADNDDELLEKRPECKGHYLMNSKSDYQPDVLAKETGRRKLSKEEGTDIVYSGCYAKVMVTLYPYSNGFGCGVGCGLGNVLKVRDGVKFSSRSDGESDFADDFGDDFEDDLLGVGSSSDDDLDIQCDDLPF